MWADEVTLVSGSGTSEYTIPDGWTSSGTVEGGSYLKLDGGTITSPEFAPHTGLSFTYSVATFGSGTNHPLTIRILNASTNDVIVEKVTSTPSSSSYITTGSPLSLGDVDVAFKIQLSAPTGKGIRLRNYSVTGTPAGGGSSLSDSDLALTSAPVALNFDLYNNSSAQTVSYTTSSTGAVTVSESDYITTVVDEINKTITVTPVAVTPANGAIITVNQAKDDTYKAGSATFTVTITDSTPGFTVTLGDDNTALTEATIGAGVTLPERATTVTGYTFAGWSETNVENETIEAPTIIPAGAYSPTSNVTLYPVFTKTEGGGTVNKTASVTISDYATANNWSNGTQYTSVVLDENINATAQGGGNTGKYYTNGNSWRIYSSENGKLILTAANDAEFTSATISFSNSTLSYGGTNITSGTAVSLSGTSAEFTAGGTTYITAISVNYTISGSTTYYWSAPVAATVEKPVITIAENPFLFSTTAEITCATSGATIKYSFDNENWNDYSEALTITETTTIYAKAVLDNDESAIASVEITKILAEPTVTIDASGITNTNVYTGTTAGNLAATVTYNETAIVGATVTWSGNNDEVATINEETGVVTLVADGSVTFTATYAGNSDYAEKTATYVMTVTNVDPNAPGSENNPYTVAEAIAATPTSGTTDNVYIKGIVSQFYNTSIVGDGNNYRYYISDDGTTTNQLLVYNGKGLNNVAFSNASDLQIGDEVVIYGGLTNYKGTKEVASGNYIVSLKRAATITVADANINVDAAGSQEEKVVTYEYITITEASDFGIQYYNADGEEISNPDWMEAQVEAKGSGYVLSYTVNANTGEERTAYLKVFATAGEEDVYSNLVTITQAKPVETVTYTLAHSITPGKHYIIASGTDGNVYVMGGQKSTNREAVEVEITTKNVISVTDEKICEFIVSKDGAYYTFFDENLNGYLNATGAGGTNNNHLKTLGVNDNKGQWSISIDDGGVATVIANATGRNTMRFNNGNSKLFSCYSSGQQNIYLFEKDNDEGSLVIPIAAACTDGTKCYATFSSTKPFVVPEDLTVSEIGIDTDGTMNVENYETGAVVPANTGVMVSAAAGDRSYVANVSTEVGNNVLNGDNRLRPTGDNGLTATEMNSAEPETCKFYRLTMHGAAENNPGKIGFWWGADGGLSFDIVANKAYLAVPASVAGTRNGFAFGDDATGISNVNVNENVNGSVFDLQGRKVSTPGKGLYIVNGKKVVIK